MFITNKSHSEKNGGDRFISLEGIWHARLADGTEGEMSLPGTLDENRLGHRDCAKNALHPDQELGNAEEGTRQDAPIATRFTRKYTYEGEAKLSRRFRLSLPEGKRVFLEAERARVLRLLVDGKEVPVWRPASISTPYIFEVTGLLDGEHEITLLSDNSYPGLPHDAIVYSSAATDETQTNWNGILGYLRLRVEERTFLSYVSVYPSEGMLRVKAGISSDEAWTGYLELESEALEHSVRVAAECGGRNVRCGAADTKAAQHRNILKEQDRQMEPAGNLEVHRGNLSELFSAAKEHEIVIEGLPLAQGVKLWDENEGNLYELRAKLISGGGQAKKDMGKETEIGSGESGEEEPNPGSRESGEGEPNPGSGESGERKTEITDEKEVTFGIRTFGDNGGGRLALNGRTIFLRSEANCAEFPETGYPPMETERWTEILERYRSYGVNCVRFHSHCPSEAAFAAADRLGMLMQPELSHWNPANAFESEESWHYYRTELEAVVRMLANHPSFVMLTFGNELHAGELGHRRMDELLDLAHSLDDTRLFANASNAHYGWAGCDPKSDFYTATGCREANIRGTFAEMKGYLNRAYPNAKRNFDESMEVIRREYKKPVFSFEAGQFEVLPDFTEFALFHGISDPANFRLIQAKVRKLGLEEDWERYVEATGELSRIGYREEVEAAMRTRELSGISLLGLQDFPGQGTALVGMMNSHLEPKPYDFAKPEHFRKFFRESLPLVLLEKYTYEAGEVLRADILVANFGKTDIDGELRYILWEKRKENSAWNQSSIAGLLGKIHCPAGCHTEAGKLEIKLDFVEKPAHFFLTVQVGEIENTYPIWVYPPVKPVCPEGVYETETFDKKALEVLGQGGTVYLTPKSDQEHLPQSIQAQFTTDFWSVGTFSRQEGGMGQLIDAEHPVFAGFPTESHTDWQWWAMASRRAVILPRPMKSIVTEMDSYAYMRPMAQLLEFRCGGGKVLLSSMELQGLQQYPEARALLSSLYSYLESEDFEPCQEMTVEEVAALAGGRGF